MLYPVSGNTTFQNQAMEVVGKKTSGEAEVVLIFGDSSEDVYVTVGSDTQIVDWKQLISINQSKSVGNHLLRKHGNSKMFSIIGMN